MAYVEGWGEFVRNECRVYEDYTESANPVFKAALAAAGKAEEAISFAYRLIEAEMAKAVGAEKEALWPQLWGVHDELCKAAEASQEIWRLADEDGRRALEVAGV